VQLNITEGSCRPERLHDMRFRSTEKFVDYWAVYSSRFGAHV